MVTTRHRLTRPRHHPGHALREDSFSAAAREAASRLAEVPTAAQRWPLVRERLVRA